MGKIKDLTNQKFGRWTALERTTKNGQIAWRCVCECGTERLVLRAMLTTGQSKSCGCLRDELAKVRETTHGKFGTPEYFIWQMMIQRCHNSKAQSYKRYGDRSITVCEAWHTFENFYADMGDRPSPDHSIERKDNDGPYEPSNCVWATRIQQQNNTSRNKKLTLNNRTQNLGQWCSKLGLNHTTVLARLDRGWSVERALTTPTRQYKRKKV